MIAAFQRYKDHPRTRRLARGLGLAPAQAMGHICGLWGWLAEYAPDGDPSGLEAADLADAAGWPGKPDRFRAALIAPGSWGDADAAADWATLGAALGAPPAVDAARRHRELGGSRKIADAVRRRDGSRCRFCAEAVRFDGDRRSDRAGRYAYLDPARPADAATIVVACKRCADLPVAARPPLRPRPDLGDLAETTQESRRNHADILPDNPGDHADYLADRAAYHADNPGDRPDFGAGLAVFGDDPAGFLRDGADDAPLAREGAGPGARGRAPAHAEARGVKGLNVVLNVDDRLTTNGQQAKAKADATGGGGETRADAPARERPARGRAARPHGGPPDAAVEPVPATTDRRTLRLLEVLEATPSWGDPDPADLLWLAPLIATFRADCPDIDPLNQAATFRDYPRPEPLRDREQAVRGWYRQVKRFLAEDAKGAARRTARRAAAAAPYPPAKTPVADYIPRLD